ncbi:Nif3-like dinuclear metal center hexameric protein [Nitrosophilus alvini]|uniref:Nif3-like dinuclear metal center hexameric protein n=1 Tax=Nitrosophilus alvini TaxID=2714855 RepID=UPI00190C0773|nr:Nif3-like dinuclear metal center hexameric protein [Nitrosophilus alvini]
MKIIDIYNILDELSPFELQEKWDNSGLQVGTFYEEPENVVLSMDIDAELLERVPANTLLIVHHPLIFSPLKSLNFSEYPSILIREMIKKNISMIAMHTNFDKTHLNRYVAHKILDFESAICDDFICYYDVDMSFEEIADLVKKNLNLPILKSVKTKERIKRVALTTGSGGSLIKEVKADLFLTGDIKYHDAMEAKAVGLSMIDIGHYESERYFAEILASHLKKYEIEVIITPSKNPFEYL